MVGFFSPGENGSSLPGHGTRPAEGEEHPLGTCALLDVDSKNRHLIRLNELGAGDWDWNWPQPAVAV